MSTEQRQITKAHMAAAHEYVSKNPGCSHLSAGLASKLDNDLDMGMKAVTQAIRRKLIRAEFTGCRTRLWPAGITLTKWARDLHVGDWYVDPKRAGRKLAKVLRVGKQSGGRAYFIVNDESGQQPWVTGFDLRDRLEAA